MEKLEWYGVCPMTGALEPQKDGVWLYRDDVEKLIPKWLSVEDSLPPLGLEVLAYVPSRKEMGRNPVTALARYIRYEGAEDFYWDNNYGGSNIHLSTSVTHWMPLSEPPKP